MPFGRLIHPASSFAAVVAAYSIYTVCVVPLIEPPLNRASGHDPLRPEADLSPTQRYREWLSPLFAADSWELNEPKILKTERSILLLRNYKTLEDGRLGIEGFTVVLLPTGRRVDWATRKPSVTELRPLVIRADAAILKSDGVFDLRQGKVGKIVGGWLPGTLTVVGAESAPGAGDSIYMKTQDVQISRDRLWTTREVDIRIGTSTITGRDLNIVLNASSGTRGRKSLVGSVASGVKSIELAQVKRIHVKFPPSAHRASAARAPAQPSDLEITCRGPFYLDLTENVASLEKEVDVLQLYPDGTNDQLSCQRVDVRFSSQKASRASQSKTPDAGQGGVGRITGSGWQIDSVAATGNPVVLRSPHRYGNITCERMEYDFLNRRFRMEDQDKVKLEYHSAQLHSEVEAPQLMYELSATGGVGSLWATGPGWLRGGDDMRTVEAAWGKQLVLRPVGGEHVLSLMGRQTKDPAPLGGVDSQASCWVRTPDLGQIRAQDIHIWLTEDSPTAPAPTRDEPRLGAATGLARRLQPKRMLADGSVQFDSVQLVGAAGRLEVWVKQAPPSTRPTGTPSGVTPSRPSVAQAPAPRGAVPRSRAVSRREPAPSKLRVRGEGIRVLLVRRQEELTLDDVSVHGAAHLTQSQSSGAADAGFEMTGDVFQLRHASSMASTASLRGQPATVFWRGMTLVGGDIQMDRGAGRVWIDGPGEARIPMKNEPLRQGARGSGPATVAWNRSMNFNGHTVQFQGAVLARTDAQQLQTETLSATLDTQVDFQDLERPSQDVRVRYLDGMGDVQLESRDYGNAGLLSIDRMYVAKFSIDLLTGDSVAEGPGWISQVSRGSSPSGLGGVPVSGRRSDDAIDEGFTFLGVTFQSGIDGNWKHRVIHLNRDVRAIYGPVRDWEEQLDVYPTERLDDRTVLMNCDRLTVAQMSSGPDGKTTFHLRALGNSVVESGGFIAYANEVKYSAQKDQLILEGDRRSKARLIRRGGGKESQTAARKFTFSRMNQSWSVEDADYFRSDW